MSDKEHSQASARARTQQSSLLTSKRDTTKGTNKDWWPN